ncbi:MAG: hypothetical protein EOP22_20090, partial [Hyphomicrobiales bacterium]
MRRPIKHEGRQENYAGGYMDGVTDSRAGTLSAAMMKPLGVEEPSAYQRGYLDGVAEASRQALPVAPARS